MTTATPTEVRHNHRTADITTAMNHGIIAVDQVLTLAKTLAASMTDALPHDPNERPDSARVRELAQHVASSWDYVTKFQDGAGNARRRVGSEQQKLDEAARNHEPDDPAYLTLVAESAQRAITDLVVLRAEMLLGKRAAGANCEVIGEAQTL